MGLSGLAGRVAIVTGAGAGIGRATALRLSREGATVAVVDRDGDRARATAAELPGGSLPLVADVADEASTDGFLRAVLDRYGAVDLVHANAGVLGPVGPLETTPVEEFDHVQNVNVRGTFLTVRGALRAMRGRRGSIVVTSSVMGVRGAAGSGAYATSKHAVVGLVRSAALDAAPSGIRINAIAPGWVRTGMLDTVHHSLPGMGPTEAAKALRSSVPLGREAGPDEVAASVAWLLSDESSYLTGAVLTLDGGRAAA